MFAARHPRLGRVWLFTLCCVLLFPAVGCETAPRQGGDAVSGAEEQAAEPISYGEIREQYNKRTDRIEQLWARAVVTPQWTDREGKRHREQGDGNLIVRKPGELALALGKLGNTFFWLGSDRQRFWLFDLKPPGDRPSTVYVGQLDEFDQISRANRLLPIRPDRVIDLLGITALPPGDTTQMTAAGRLGSHLDALSGDSLEFDEGYYVGHALPRKQGEAPTHAVLMLLNEAYLPHRVMVLPLRDQSLKAALQSGRLPEPELIAELSDYKRMKQAGKGLGRWPKVPTLIEARMPAREANLKLDLSDMTDGKRADRIKDVQFDFERLLKIHNPQRVRELRAGTSEQADAAPASIE